MALIKGIGTINATPITKDERLNEGEYRRHICWMAENGIGFIQPAAATGEAMSFSDEEYKRILEISVDELKGSKCLVTAYAGRADTRHTIKLAKIARDLGCAAAYIIQPYFSRPDARGQYLHYKAIAEAVPDLPLVFYNNPQRAGSGSSLEREMMLRLVTEHKNFVALKQTDLNAFLDDYPALQDKITVWPKSEKELIVALAYGSPGVITFAGNIIPAQLVEIQRKWQAGDHAGARDLYFKILPLINIIHVEPVPSAVKYMLNRMGWDFGPFLPHHPVAEENAKKIDAVLKQLEDFLEPAVPLAASARQHLVGMERANETMPS